jgi:hypothetical protein
MQAYDVPKPDSDPHLEIRVSCALRQGRLCVAFSMLRVAYYMLCVVLRAEAHSDPHHQDVVKPLDVW